MARNFGDKKITPLENKRLLQKEHLLTREKGKVDACKAEIKTLKADNKRLKGLVNDLTKENKRLKANCSS